MSIVGLGTDIAEIDRVEKALNRSGDAFARRILADDEYQKYAQIKQQARFLAKRFAAKEAASKALGTGIAHGVTFHDFVVSNDENGKPVLTLTAKAKEIADNLQVNHIHLSISDERHYAVATVVMEK
ncbi:holo-ACP synthase [Vibrio sp. SCSIO 43137]|uniref:holo-ACP synthase n=1 Tax=Vibrio sp. SCSIO 43137 TaxID=3021011 RepID=UPI002306F2A4|nr:holo-ACP synthase [Vibrio sp. SCSIO 43137]WCE30175.1 holo-ACP synthase [Vibrio sp. SCSIO 43137]